MRSSNAPAGRNENIYNEFGNKQGLFSAIDKEGADKAFDLGH
jgi:hypothetical protein